MLFDVVFNFPHRNPPVRAYFRGEEEVFGEFFPPERTAMKHLRKVLSEEDYSSYNFLIPFVYGLEGKKRIDLFGFKIDKSLDEFNMENGILVPNLSISPYADDEIDILFEEGIHRDKCCRLEDYALGVPSTLGINNIIQIGRAKE